MKVGTEKDPLQLYECTPSRKLQLEVNGCTVVLSEAICHNENALSKAKEIMLAGYSNRNVQQEKSHN